MFNVQSWNGRLCEKICLFNKVGFSAKGKTLLSDWSKRRWKEKRKLLKLKFSLKIDRFAVRDDFLQLFQIISFELIVAFVDKNRSFLSLSIQISFLANSIEDLVDLKPITWLMGQTNWNYLILNIGKSNGWDRDGSWIKSAIKCTFEIPVQSDTQNLNSNFWYTEPRCC